MAALTEFAASAGGLDAELRDARGITRRQYSKEALAEPVAHFLNGQLTDFRNNRSTACQRGWSDSTSTRLCPSNLWQKRVHQRFAIGPNAIGVLSTVVGLTAVRDSVAHELNDLSHAFGTVSQSYNVTSLKKSHGDGGSHAYVKGFGFNDSTDECDCSIIELVQVCGKNDSSEGDPE